ncbi:MAG: hypothetical protein KKB20_19100 [Proteobacteria bacterium]|nr:hypothetical protein [Pseudomonadota bacterium]
MTSYRSCKRCSVSRVNSLVELYELAFRKRMAQERNMLEHLVRLASERGYEAGRQLLDPNLSESGVRALAWNVSSLLEDEDLERLGLCVTRK